MTKSGKILGVKLAKDLNTSLHLEDLLEALVEKLHISLMHSTKQQNEVHAEYKSSYPSIEFSFHLWYKISINKGVYLATSGTKIQLMDMNFYIQHELHFAVWYYASMLWVTSPLTLRVDLPNEERYLSL